jgi:hypothetical protein
MNKIRQRGTSEYFKFKQGIGRAQKTREKIFTRRSRFEKAREKKKSIEEREM